MILAVLAACTHGSHGVDSGTSSGPPDVPGRVAVSSELVKVGYPDVVLDSSGRVWLTYTRVASDGNGGNESADVMLTWSDDRGVTFAPPVVVDDVDQLFLGTVRQPILAVDDHRVAITVGGGSYRDSSIQLYVASVDDPGTFESHVLDSAFLGYDQPNDLVTLVDQPELAFDPSGQLLVTWKRGTKLESFSFVQAAESDGFTPVPVDDHSRGEPCECCPVDLLVWPDGETQLAFRNNDRNIRDIWIADAAQPTDPYEHAGEVSTTHWKVGGCPFDGPILAADDSVLVASWVDGSLGDTYGFVTTSTDRGRTWTENRRLLPDNDESQTWPSGVIDADGAVWVSIEEIFHQTRVLRSEDHGATFTEVPDVLVDGDAPLFYAELTTSVGRVGLVGVTDDGAVWYVESDDQGSFVPGGGS